MAERFIGMTVALSLSNNAQLKGTVSKVDSTTQILHLRDVSFLPNGGNVPNYSVEASHISSLQIVPYVATPSIATPSVVSPSANPPTAPKPSADFQDPAILSFARKPSNDTKKPVHILQSQEKPAVPVILPTTQPKTSTSFPEIQSLTIDHEAPTPSILPQPNLIRPKPRKPPPPSSPTLQPPRPQRGPKPPRRRTHSRLSDSGWLTDEIVDGQVKEFDFETNLEKFDKRRDWEEFRKMDTTDPKSLLVYHNKISTAPKYTQNFSHKTKVLDRFSSSDESDDEQPVRRGSRQTRRPTSGRKASVFTSTGNMSRTSSSVGVTWRVVGEEPADVVSVTAEQMAKAEKLAVEGGISEDILVENAGRGIAEAVLTSLSGKRLDRKNHNAAPLVVVLVGNNRTGAYAVCAGRWLSLRGVRVLGVVCAGEEEELDIIRTQLKLFRSAGGRKVVPGDLQRTIAALPTPPEILLDGLFGYLHSLDDIWDDEDKFTCIELIKWANSLRGRRISIDKPSVAKSSIDDQVEMALSSEWVIEVGAMKEDVTFDKSVRTFVVDIGFTRSIWKAAGVLGTGKNRKGDLGINWGGKWAVEVENVL